MHVSDDVADLVREQPLRLGVGVHEVAFEQYLADPCIEPSLNASGAAVLIEQTPAHFQAYHPRLSPWRADASDEDEPVKQDRAKRLGSLVHALVLGQGKTFRICDFPDWRTKAAKEARADALVCGEMPVLASEHAQAQVISKWAKGALVSKFGRWPIGDSERCVVWRRDTAHGPIYCRAAFDHWSDDRTLICDLKTTARSTEANALARKLSDDGADYQNAWYVDGAEALHPHLAGRIQFIFCVVEVDPPYAVRFVELPTAWTHMARRRLDGAADTFARCLKRGRWPGYGDTTTTLQMPGYLERQWLTDELEEEAA